MCHNQRALLLGVCLLRLLKQPLVNLVSLRVHLQGCTVNTIKIQIAQIFYSAECYIAHARGEGLT